MMMVTKYNAPKVFFAGVFVAVVGLEGYSWLTRDARAPGCFNPLAVSPPSYCCTADPNAPPHQDCKCMNCGMNPVPTTSKTG